MAETETEILNIYCLVCKSKAMKYNLISDHVHCVRCGAQFDADEINDLEAHIRDIEDMDDETDEANE